MNKNALNQRQKIAYDLIVQALKLNMDESATDGGNDISHLQSSLGKGGAGNPHLLGVVIAALKEKRQLR